MGLAVIIFMCGIALWAAWVAWTVSRDGGIPPYQDSQCNQDCRQGRDCDCYQRSCDMTVEEYDNWPFPKAKP